MKIYLFLLLSISSFRNQKVSGNEDTRNSLASAPLLSRITRTPGREVGCTPQSCFFPIVLYAVGAIK